MGRVTDKDKKDFAYILYMNGELQKNICQRVGITPRTLSKYIDDSGWKELRTAKTITKTELINKTLSSIGKLLDKALDNSDDDEEFNKLSDRLSKLAKTVTSLEKGNSVVDDFETFKNFINFLQIRMTTDSELDLEFIKKINRYQDSFIKERFNQK